MDTTELNIHRAIAEKPAPITLTGIPMPPSVNAAYQNNTRGNGRGRSKTEAAKLFDRDAYVWALQNCKALVQARRAIFQQTEAGMALKIKYRFIFRNDQLWSKKLGMKRIDASNRIKIVEDFLADTLMVDDSVFFAGEFEKVAGPEGQEPSVTVEITFMQVKK